MYDTVCISASDVSTPISNAGSRSSLTSIFQWSSGYIGGPTVGVGRKFGDSDGAHRIFKVIVSELSINVPRNGDKFVVVISYFVAVNVLYCVLSHSAFLSRGISLLLLCILTSPTDVDNVY